MAKNSFYDGWRTFKENIIDLILVTSEQESKRRRLNKMIRHPGKDISLNKGLVKSEKKATVQGSNIILESKGENMVKEGIKPTYGEFSRHC